MGFIHDHPAIDAEEDAPRRGAFGLRPRCLTSQGKYGHVDARGLSAASRQVDRSRPRFLNNSPGKTGLPVVRGTSVKLPEKVLEVGKCQWVHRLGPPQS